MTMARYWAVWAIVGFLAFIVPELWAVFTGRYRDTLSATLWRVEKLGPGNPLHWTFIHFSVVVILICLLVWLVGHFGWGIWG